MIGSLTVSVLVPSYRRPTDLERCLAALAEQSRTPDEILVVHRADDSSTKDLLDEYIESIPQLRPVVVYTPGVVAALNAGLNECSCDIVCITDDDAAPYKDWVDRIVEIFESSNAIGAVGGKDVVHQGERIITGSASVVGRIQWFGRHIGNHHIGVGDIRDVEVLKGVNMSYRRHVIASIGLDRRLLGSGAQVANDLMLSLEVKKRGWRIVYDPKVLVDHFPSVRHDEDKRAGFSAVATSNRAHNETLALLEYLPFGVIPFYLLWAIMLGNRDAPGIFHHQNIRNRDVRLRYDATIASISGRIKGLKTWLNSRSSQNR